MRELDLYIFYDDVANRNRGSSLLNIWLASTNETGK